MDNATGNEVRDLPRFASRQYEQQIASLQNDCALLECKVRNRNWMIVGMIGAFALAALLVAVGLWTNVLTVDFSEDNLSVQLERAKAELEKFRAEAEKLKSELERFVPKPEERMKVGDTSSAPMTASTASWRIKLFGSAALLALISLLVRAVLCSNKCSNISCKDSHAVIGVGSAFLFVILSVFALGFWTFSNEEDTARNDAVEIKTESVESAPKPRIEY
jgi:uncharacterized membrane protein